MQDFIRAQNNIMTKFIAQMRAINETSYMNQDVKVATVINKAERMIFDLNEIIELKTKRKERYEK